MSMEQQGTTTDSITACYGRRFGRLPACASCPYADYCQEAGEPSPLTGPNAGPSGDDAAFERLCATMAAATEMPDAAPADEQPDANQAVACLGELLAAVASACDLVPDRISAVVFRMLGLSMEQIGALCGKTRQAVHKDVGRIEAEDARLGHLLRQRFAMRSERALVLCDALRTLRTSRGQEAGRTARDGQGTRAMRNAAMAADLERRRAEQPRRPLTGDGGLYADLAADWGLSSWVAAQARIRRAFMANGGRVAILPEGRLTAGAKP